MKKIAVIGVGNIGGSIVSGILQSEKYKAEQLIATRGKNESLDDLKEKGIYATYDNLEAVEKADIVILALKPYLIQPVLQELKPKLKKDKHVIVSVATKNTLADLENNSIKGMPVFRVIPNTAASVGESVNSICSKNATPEQEGLILDIFNQIGESLLISESLINPATVLASSGTAYAIRYVRAMIQAGIQLGLDEKSSRKMVIQTVKGAMELLQQTGNHPEAEIDRVTTPGGSTITGLNELENNGFSSAIIKAMKSATDSIS
ncbi:MAG: pyrroline-5-carboxylate reductase [Flavobacteriales bacterium]|nr:pyrroline-5-carboxylate reductase [Flavobacteriales bacterium]